MGPTIVYCRNRCYCLDIRYPVLALGGEKVLLIRALGKLASFHLSWQVRCNPFAISALELDAEVGNVYLMFCTHILSNVCHHPQALPPAT